MGATWIMGVTTSASWPAPGPLEASEARGVREATEVTEPTGVDEATGPKGPTDGAFVEGARTKAVSSVGDGPEAETWAVR